MLVFTFGSFRIQAATDNSITSNNKFTNLLITNEVDVDIFQITQIGPAISIVLDYSFNATSQLEINESLVVLVIFSITTQEDPFTVKASMLFFHAGENKSFLFWMFGDPFRQVQNWQPGIENVHFVADNDLLTLNFIEFLEISDPEIESTVLAKITSGTEVSAYTNDFRTVLEQFITDLPISYEFPFILSTTSEGTSGSSTTTTGETGTTTTKGDSSQTTESVAVDTPGLTIFSSIGIFLSLLITKKIRRKK
jgi:hypothetical protein